MLRRWMIGGAWLLTSVPCATAGVNTWTAAGPQGGEVREIAMHPGDPNIAVAIAFSGVYRTTNGGASWTLSSHVFQNPPYDLQVDPSDFNRLYVFSFSNPHIAMSADGGVTFQAIATLPAQAPEPRLALANGGVMYYTAGRRVFRSNNRGASWEERTEIQGLPDARVRSIVVDGADTALYAMVDMGAAPRTMFVSLDGAMSWTRRADYDNDHAVRDVALHPLDGAQVWAQRNDGLWRSNDYGSTWTNVHFTQRLFDVTLNMRGADLHVAAAGFEGLFQSTDGGVSWTEITGDLPTMPRTIAAHPIFADRMMLGGDAGIHVPGASAGTWVTRHQGINATHVRAFEVDSTTDRIYAQSSSGVHLSVGGAEFEPINNRRLATIGSPPLPKPLSAIHAQPGNLLALLSDELASSPDGGATWTLMPGQPVNRQEQLWQLESSRADPLNLIVAGMEGAYRSSNGGGSWTRVTGGLPASFSTYELELADSNPSVVYLSPYVSSPGVLQPLGIYRSSDGGSNWVAANAGIADIGVHDIDIDPTDAQVVYAATFNSVVKSTDGGSTWRTLLPNLTPNIRIGIDPTRPRIVYVVHANNAILRSVNGGERFEALRPTGSLPFWLPGAVVVDPRRPNVVNVGTGGFGVQQMSIEPDLELAWSSGPASAAIGTTTSYAVSVRNRGPYASSGAEVTVQFPAGATGIAASTQSGSCTLQETNARCVLGPLVLNASASISLSATQQVAGSFAANATVQGDQPDANGSNNAASHSVVVSAPTSGGGGGGGSSLLLLLACATLLSGAQRLWPVVIE